MVDVADRVQPVGAAHEQRVVDLSQSPGLEADALEPEVAGARARGRSRRAPRSATTVSRRSRSTTAFVSVRTPDDGDIGAAPWRRSLSAFAHRSPAKGSWPPSRPLRATSVTVAAELGVGRRHLARHHAAADDGERGGTSCALVASRLVHGALGEPGDVGQQRRRSGADRHGVAGGE